MLLSSLASQRGSKKVCSGCFPFAPSDQLLAFLYSWLCSKRLTSLGCIHLVLLPCGFWLDLGNVGTSRRGEGRRKRKVGVLLLCSLFVGATDYQSLFSIEVHISYQEGGIPNLQLQLLFWKWAPCLAPSDLSLLMVYPLGAFPNPDGFP